MTAPFVLASWCAHSAARALSRRNRDGALARPAARETQDTEPAPARADHDAHAATPVVR
jgi:urea transporter